MADDMRGYIKELGNSRVTMTPRLTSSGNVSAHVAESIASRLIRDALRSVAYISMVELESESAQDGLRCISYYSHDN
jgi:hypothetical protein